jgi:hypothetical protein
MRSGPLSALISLLISATCGAVDLWDLPPLRYADTAAGDPVSKLAAEIRDGRRIEGMEPLGRLRFVLDLLDVPEESQVLVFSKTSKQNPLIHPGNPRCLFFNENAYVGYVPGGDIEVAAYDPLLGPVFHLIRGGGQGEPLRVKRDTSDCLSCHGTARTESVPGVLVRSVFPDENGMPILPLGTYLIDHTSPLAERWGGYYVTGKSSLPHLGNRTFLETDERALPDQPVQLATLAGRIDVSRYPRATSDIVALMVLEHQCRIHNLLTAASMNYRRASFLAKALDPASDPDLGSAGKIADAAAEKIIAALLFENEADLGEDGIEGYPAFQEAFTRRFPKSKEGRSLADFHLGTRIFKHRCSYMLYSAAFAALPARVKSALVSGLRMALETPVSSGDFPHLADSERRRIAAILADTLPDWSGPH